ncbi:MAG TPA: hypothetical protein VD931_08290 [Baekduia sp.]|nr:hypothetical protein [Baekduia sp.]
MTPPRRALDRAPALRGAAVVATGALALHQTRYALGGEHAAGATASGHAYLDVVVALVAALAAVALGALAACLLRPASGGPGAHPASWRRRWLTLAGAVLAAHAAHELLAGALTAGHPAGLHGLLADGGWAVLPLAAAAGAVGAALLRGADALVARAAVTARQAVREAVAGHPLPRSTRPRHRAAALRHLRGRPPPARRAPALLARS